MAGARKNILPGFGLSMGYTVVYLSAVVLIPLATLLVQPIGMGWERFFKAVTSPRAIASYGVSFQHRLHRGWGQRRRRPDRVVGAGPVSFSRKANS